MLFALLIGLAMNFLGDVDRCNPGIAFTSKFVLRLGVALLGLKITMTEVMSLGWSPLLLVVGAVALTIGASTLAARWMGFDPRFGVLSGGATAICGASAAMAISAALPSHPRKEYATLFTVVGVSILSTVAMLLYPAIARFAGLDDTHAGIFIGATVHDVAQVIGRRLLDLPRDGRHRHHRQACARRDAPARDRRGRRSIADASTRRRRTARRSCRGSPRLLRFSSSPTASFPCPTGSGRAAASFHASALSRDCGAGDEDPDQGHCVRRLAASHIDGAGDHLHRRDRAYRNQVRLGLTSHR